MNRELKSKIVLKFGTQQDFADAIGETPSKVSNVIRGRHKLSKVDKLLWAMFLKCSLREVFPDKQSAGKSDDSHIGVSNE